MVDTPNVAFAKPTHSYARFGCFLHCFLLTAYSKRLIGTREGGGEWDDLVTFGTHTAHLTDMALFVQLLFGFVLQLTDVLHRQSVPAVHPAEHLPKQKRGTENMERK